MARLQMKLVFVFKINAVLYISLILCLGGNEVRLFLNFDDLRFFLPIIGANTPEIGHAPEFGNNQLRHFLLVFENISVKISGAPY